MECLEKPIRHFSLLLLYNKRRQFLLQLRPKDVAFLPDHWCSFGGEILPGESPEDALVREVKRELNYEVKDPKYVCTSIFDHQDFQSHLHVFAAFCSDPNELKLMDGADWGWFHVDELEKMKIQPHDRYLIRFTKKWLGALAEKNIAFILLYDHQGKVLLQQRDDERSFLPGYWSFFGGKIEAGEDPVQAVIRETMEELEYPLKNPIFVLKTSFQHHTSRSYLSMFTEAYDQSVPLKLHEGKDLGWFTLEETDELQMLESDRDLLAYTWEFIHNNQREESFDK